MSRLFNRCSLWIVDRRWLAVLMMLVITAIAVAGYLRPNLIQYIVVSLNGQTSEEDEPESFVYYPPSEEIPQVKVLDITDSDAILVVESNSIFTPRGADAVRAIVKELEESDFVSQVTWMDQIPGINIFGLPEPVLPSSNATQKRFDVARQKAIEHPFVGGQLLSKDAKTMLVLINFEFFFVKSEEDCLQGLNQIAERAASQFKDIDLQFVTTGKVPIYLTIVSARDSNRLKYQIIAYSLIAVLSIILFRGVTAIGIVGVAPAVGVFWTLGFIRLFNFQHNPFNDVILPVMISLVGFTDGVHLMVQIRKLRAEGMSPRDASRQGMQLVGLACALTSLTTAIGFGSLVLAHHDLVREFGLCCVIGVTLSFIAVITTIPLLSSTWLGRRVQIGHSRGLVDRNLGRISYVVDFVLKHVNKFAFGGIVTTILLIGVCSTLRPDEKRIDILPTSSQASIGLQKMDRAMGGLEFASINIHWNPSVESDSPEVLEVIRRFDEILESDELIGNPLSIRKLIDALPGEGEPEDRISMLELLPPPIKRAFYEPEVRSSSIHFRVQDLGVAAYAPIFSRLQEEATKIESENPNFKINLHGRSIDNWRHLYQIILDLVTSLGTASVVIFLVLGIVYRSLRIGLISIIPNVFPLAVAGTYLALSGMSLEVVSVCAFTVCLGIAVDDTIHFLTRYQEEMKKGDHQKLAIKRAFTAVGTALIMTTLVLVAGLVSVLFSEARDHRIFAKMGAITVAAALFGDMVFLPAILAKFDKRKSK